MKKETLMYIQTHLSDKEINFFEDEMYRRGIDPRSIISIFFDKETKTVCLVLEGGKVAEIKIKKV
ncbi:MAG: hypothetical protein PHO23_00810 [Candidatus Pacebacteria bacterium]|nr:hypothetical protein [Candidatus Paceibacterota bacterium]